MKTAETTLNEGKWIETRQNGEQVVSRQNALDFAKAYGRQIAQAVLKEAAGEARWKYITSSDGTVEPVVDKDSILNIDYEQFIK